MHTLQMIQQLDAASLIVALLALPWLAVMLMHAASTQYRVAANEPWNARADAAVRWARAAFNPASSNGGTVLKFAARRQPHTSAVQSHGLHAA